MLSYYTVIIAFSLMVLAVLCVLVKENGWIPKSDKWLFYTTYLLIALSALAEWIGIQLSGNVGVPRWALVLVKCADYILTPMAGGAVVGQMKIRDREHYMLLGVLMINVIFQVFAAVNGWMITIDAHNHYTHGPFYQVYMIIYVVVIALMALKFLAYGKAYRKQNRASLYAVLVLVIAGIVMQEAFSGRYRTAYLGLTMGAALLFIHYTEFYQMAMDEDLKRHHTQIMKDELTGALSRHAYSKALKDFDAMERLPEDLAAFALDINGLKLANDMLGHDAGDELIIGAYQCIDEVLREYGSCYRTGGDEFVVLANLSREQADEALYRLEHVTKQWIGEKVKELGLSTGYALSCDYPGLSVEKLVREADQAMYAAKAEYYRRSGHNRSELGWAGRPLEKG